MNSDQKERQEHARRYGGKQYDCGGCGGIDQCGDTESQQTDLKDEYGAGFCSCGVDVREEVEQGQQIEQEDYSEKDEVCERDCEGGAQWRSFGEGSAGRGEGCEEFASGAPVDIAEGKDRQQQSGQCDNGFTERAAEEQDGQRQQQDQGQSGGSDERQDSEIERGAEEGIETVTAAERTAVVFDGQGQECRGGEDGEVVAVGDESGGDGSEEGNGQAGSGVVEVVADGEASEACSGEEHQQTSDPPGPAGTGVLEAEQQFFGGSNGQKTVARDGDGFREEYGGGADIPHRDDGECREGQKRRNERLPCDVEIHVGAFFGVKLAKKAESCVNLFKSLSALGALFPGIPLDCGRFGWGILGEGRMAEE